MRTREVSKQAVEWTSCGFSITCDNDAGFAAPKLATEEGLV